MPVPQGSKKKASQQFTTLPAELVAAINNLNLTKGQKSRAQLFCDRIINMFEDADLSFKHEFLEIYSNYFYKIDSHYQRVLNPLKAAGIIQTLTNCDGLDSYKVGSYPISYRINPELITNNFIETSYTSSKCENDIMDEIMEAEIMSMQRKVRIDKEAADAYVADLISNLTTKAYRVVNVDDIASDLIQVYYGTGRKAYPMQKAKALQAAKETQQELFLSNNKYVIDTPEEFLARKAISIKLTYSRLIAKIAKGIFPKPRKSITNNRVSNVFTSLANGLIPFITVESERIVSNDLSNSQFTLLAYILKGMNTNINTIDTNIKDIIDKYELRSTIALIVCPPISEQHELQLFIDNAENGRLYEYYESGLQIKDRVTTKDMMYSVVFSSASYQSSQKKRFKQLTPFILKLVDVFKKNNDGVDVNGDKHKGSLPVMLQKVEAYIFTERVYAALQAAGVWFMTKHDEILCKESDAAKVKEIVKNTLGEIGIKGVVKTDKSVKPNDENTFVIGGGNTSDVANNKSESDDVEANLSKTSGEPKLSFIQMLESHFEDDHVFNEWFCLKVMPALT